MTEKKDQYMGLVLDGASPFNGRPSTQYRQAVLGVMKDPFCYEPSAVTAPDDVTLASGLAVLPRMPFVCPKNNQHNLTVKVKEPFDLTHERVKGYRLTTITYITKGGDWFAREGNKLAAYGAGEYTLTVVETYEGIFECKHTYEIRVIT